MDFRSFLRCLVGAVLCLAATAAARAQPVRLTRADGLASDYVQALYLDRSGYLWSATDAGAVRFDGRTFEAFSVDDGLPHHYVYRFAEDENGRLWASTFDGIARFDGRRWHREHDACEVDLRHTPVGLACTDASGTRLRIGGRWQAPWGPGGGAPVVPPSGRTAFVEAPSGLWRVDAGAAPRRVGGPGVCAMPVAGQGCGPAGTRFVDADGRHAALTVMDGFQPRSVVALEARRAASPSGWAWQPVDTVAAGDRARFHGASGRLAVYRSHTPDLIVHDVRARSSQTYTLAGGIEDAVFDAAGTLWVGTFGGGLARLDPDAPVRLADGIFSRLLPASDGGVWASGPGLWRVDARARSAMRTPMGLGAAPLRALADAGDGTLVVSSEPLAWRVGAGRAPRPAFVEPSWVSGLDVRSDTLWVSSYGGGVVRLPRWGDTRVMPRPSVRDYADTDFAPVVPVAGLPTRVVEDLVRLPSGLWALTRSHGALRLTGARLARGHAEGLPSSAVFSIYEAPDGTRWYGTDRGVAREDPTGIATLGAADLSGQRVVGFVEGDGGLWIVGERDLFRLDGRRLRRAGSLLPGLRASVNAVRRVGDALVLATTDGLFRAPLDRPRRAAPRLTVQQVRVDERAVPMEPHARGWRLARLAPGTHRLDVLATPVALDGGASVEFRVGDGAWETVGADGRIVLPRVPPGAYRLAMRAVGADGQPSAVQTLAVDVAPFWWQRPGVWGAGAVLLGLTIWGSVRLAGDRRLRARVAAFEAERRVADERERISRDLHDHVGGQLTTLASLADLARMLHDRGDSGRAAESLDTLGSEARQALRQLRQTVFTLRHEALTPEALLDQLTAQADGQVQAVEGVALSVDLRTDDAATPLPTPVVLPVLRVAQEAVTNALKHARPSRIDLALDVNDLRLVLTVRDDGVGMPPPGGVHDGSGLLIMRARANDLGGTLDVGPVDGGGTAVVLSVPLRGDHAPELR